MGQEGQNESGEAEGLRKEESGELDRAEPPAGDRKGQKCVGQEICGQEEKVQDAAQYQQPRQGREDGPEAIGQFRGLVLGTED